MPDIYGSFFEYAGVSSALPTSVSKSGLVFANAETERQTLLYGAKTGVYAINKKENRRYITNDDASEAMLSFDIDIVTEDGSTLVPTERRIIQKWLFGSKKFNKLYINDKDCWEEYPDVMTKSMYLNCRFLNPEVIESGGGVIGYKATLEADSNMLWEDPTTKTISCTGTPSDTSSLSFSVEVCSDSGDYIYPEVAITAGSSGAKEIKICNYSDDSTRYTTFSDIPANARIVMKGGVNYITPSYFSKWRGENFVRLVDGKNNLIVSGAVSSISVEFQNRRFL